MIDPLLHVVALEAGRERHVADLDAVPAEGDGTGERVMLKIHQVIWQPCVHLSEALRHLLLREGLGLSCEQPGQRTSLQARITSPYWVTTAGRLTRQTTGRSRYQRMALARIGAALGRQHAQSPG